MNVAGSALGGTIKTPTDNADPLIQRVREWADEAVAWTTEEIYRRYSQLLTPFGIKGRHHTKQDLHYHIEFLVGSLATSEPEYFRTYVRWLAGVLGRRGVPTATLPESLSLLLRFYEERLGSTDSAPIAAIVKAGLATFADPSLPRGPYYHSLAPPAMAGVERLTESLIEGDAAKARLQVTNTGDGHRYLQIATRLFQPALYAVGDMWEQNQITVAQEHLATAISRTILAQLYLDADFAPPVTKKALFACVEGNQHSLGLRMVSDAFEISGWSTQYLGGNVPTEALRCQIEDWRPDLVGLSAAIVQHLPTMRDAVAMLRGEFGSRCPTILVGGLGINQVENIWRWVGADIWCADTEKAGQLG